MADGQSDLERAGSVTSGELLSDGQLQRLKRLRNYETDGDDEEFIEVGKTRRLSIRSYRHRENSTTSMKKDETQPAMSKELGKNYEVAVTAIKPLPKPIALAKLLSSLKMEGILRIKYKSNYKVFITFDTENNAECLLKSKSMVEMDFRCQRTDEINVCYGIVRQIDLDSKEEELHKIFECESEIISVRRLKRQTSEGTWVDCETVRLCFRTSTIPPYVLAYGCRFLVEPYTFPVSQCAGCWSYGHIKKYCPIKKILCPKCGAKHENCETKNYRCINCKGPHMSIEKRKCPVFQKEKDIRQLMSEEKCTYKKALAIYLDRKSNESSGSQNTIVNNDIQPKKPTHTAGRSYSEVLMSKMNIEDRDEEQMQSERCDSQQSNNESIIFQRKEERQYRKSRKKKRKSVHKEQASQEEQSEFTEGEPKCEKKFDFIKCFSKIKNIIMSRKLLNEKITECVNVIFEECYYLVAQLLRKGDYVSKLLSVLRHG